MKSLVQLFAVLLVLSGCAGGVGAISSGERYVAQDASVEDYRLGIGDKLRLIVFNEQSLSGEFQVSPDGKLSVPLIGPVDAIGKAPATLANEIQARFADGYLRDPKISIEVLTYRPYFILGEVKKPGQYPYASGMTVMNAIATAEGYTPRSDRNFVFLRRSGDDHEQRYRLTPDLRIRPGDTVRLGERFF